VTVVHQPARRPGGRTARVRKAVHHAALELLSEHDWHDISIPRVAQRSGVHQATIYRRWGNLPALVDDIVVHELAQSGPIPDTGSLRGDLEQYAVEVAEKAAGPLGLVFLRAAVLAIRSDPDRAQLISVTTRGQQLQEMLDRAAARGETVPSLSELLEVVLAPLYFHVLFFARPADADHARALVHRLLDITGASR
jgi:AcrR family transcriptional regulator